VSELTDRLSDLIARGGYVMVPLLALSLVALALIVERTWFWLGLRAVARGRRIRSLTRALRTGDRPTAERLAADDGSPFGGLARSLLTDGVSDAVVLESVETHRPAFERFMVVLSTIITAAPLLGILGTVIGIIRSFNLLGSEQVLTDPRAVSIGIAEALLTTALGLVVALVTLFPYMLFKAQVDRALGRMEFIAAAAQEGMAGRSSAPDAARRDDEADRRGSTGSAAS